MESMEKVIKLESQLKHPESSTKSKNIKLWLNEIVKSKLSTDFDSKSLYRVIYPRKNLKRTDIAELFIPLIAYLRLLGFCPVAINRDMKTGYVRYDFCLKSFITVWNLALSIPLVVYTTWMVIYCIWFCFVDRDLYEVLKFQGVDIPKEQVPKNLSAVTEFGTRLVPSTFPLFSALCILGGILCFPSLIKGFNKWAEFQKEYFRAFPHRCDDPFLNIKEFRNGKFAIFLFIGTGAIMFLGTLIHDCRKWNGCLFPAQGHSTFVFIMTMMIIVGLHGVQLLLFRTLREIFIQIREGIRTWTEVIDMPPGSSEYNKELFENAKKWMNVIILAKKQVEYACQAGAFHNMSTIFINFIYLCLGIFSSMQGAIEWNRGYVLLLFCVWGFSLLAIKAFMCEGITTQEKRVIEQLRKVETTEYSPALIQMNNLIDLMVREPVEIRFWNILTLNKSFLVRLVGQVATYLIVLIQFDNMA